MQTESLKTKKGNKKDSLSVHKIFLNYQGLDTVRKICQYCTRQSAINTLSLNACLNQMNQELSYLLSNCIELD